MPASSTYRSPFVRDGSADFEDLKSPLAIPCDESPSTNQCNHNRFGPRPSSITTPRERFWSPSSPVPTPTSAASTVNPVPSNYEYRNPDPSRRYSSRRSVTGTDPSFVTQPGLDPEIVHLGSSRLSRESDARPKRHHSSLYDHTSTSPARAFRPTVKEHSRTPVTIDRTQDAISASTRHGSMSASRSAHDHEYDFLEEEKRLLDLQRGLSDDSKKWASLRKSTRALEDRSRVTRRIAFDLQDTAIADTSASTMVPPDSAKGLSTLSTGNASDSVSNMDIDLHTDINMSLGLDDLDPGLDTDFDFGLLGKSITTAADSADGHDMLSLRVDIPSNDHLVPSLDAQLDTQQTQMDWLVQIVSKGDQQIRNLEERLALQGGSS